MPQEPRFGFVRIQTFNEEHKHGKQRRFVVVNLEGKEIAVIYANPELVQLGKYIVVDVYKIVGDKCLVGINSGRENGYGFLLSEQWILKQDILLPNLNTSMGAIGDGELSNLKCGECGSKVVFARGGPVGFWVCSKCRLIQSWL